MRGIRATLIVLIVLGALFVGADRAAVYVAENQAADKIRNSQGLSGTPDVSIKGFPFLTQIADSRLDEVDVKLDGGITAESGGRSIRVSGFDARLHGVRINSSFTSAVADRASGTAHISYEDLTKAVGEPGATVGYAGQGQTGKVKVTGHVKIMGQDIERSVISSVSIVDGNTVRVHADEIPAQGLPGVEEAVRKKTDFDRRITGLPKGLKLDKVEATPTGVDITLTGSDVNLAG
ncbi:LmeA family phospholipid-binding protein [Streptomyces morookaense]|uniref:DUF2993 domain-containing protein n=1 Tax=Streptomyces morookaense TaxID=1970 RepID=A0A7Y7EB80_STRMO|nr:DUF2993 domain-containing protein [Streptomyces morookaense]NVK82304.1 DUF2993 domain-containing protein [Streptomyces morookaense]GHF18711.1 hypothetical protein GCM10010359_20500 [Streptomyces morookaense]